MYCIDICRAKPRLAKPNTRFLGHLLASAKAETNRLYKHDRSQASATINTKRMASCPETSQNIDPVVICGCLSSKRSNLSPRRTKDATRSGSCTNANVSRLHSPSDDNRQFKRTDHNCTISTNITHQKSSIRLLTNPKTRRTRYRSTQKKDRKNMKEEKSCLVRSPIRRPTK